jgi:hypothetical protein
MQCICVQKCKNTHTHRRGRDTSPKSVIQLNGVSQNQTPHRVGPLHQARPSPTPPREPGTVRHCNNTSSFPSPRAASFHSVPLPYPRSPVGFGDRVSRSRGSGPHHARGRSARECSAARVEMIQEPAGRMPAGAALAILESWLLVGPPAGVGRTRARALCGRLRRTLPSFWFLDVWLLI